MSKRFSYRTSNRAFGCRLRLVRLVLGLSEEDTATAMSITIRTLRKWEAGGSRTNSASPFVEFSRKYDVSLDWLLMGEAGGIGAHLAKRSTGKLAILPAISPEGRRRLMWQKPVPPPQPPLAS
jgi:transcriptional regulator with XRE-family HTH domain